MIEAEGSGEINDMNPDPAIVEFANDAFYAAFNRRDLAGMSDLWAQDMPCVCIHPGWRPIVGRDEILRSWEHIFKGRREGEDIVCHHPKVLNQGTFFSVLCYEQMPEGWLAATNNFAMEGGRMRIFHHQAGHCVDPPSVDEPRQTVQ